MIVDKIIVLFFFLSNVQYLKLVFCTAQFYLASL